MKSPTINDRDRRSLQVLSNTTVIPREFYARDARQVARELLGTWVVRRSCRGSCVVEIVETEAYLASGDEACHASRGRTPRNAAMFGSPGTAYVYAIHSRWCFNIVCQARGEPAAVLVRAARPILGAEVMSELRGHPKPLDLLRGPSRLCEALNIDKRLNRWRLDRETRLWLAHPREPAGPLPIAVSPRIGVTSAHDLPLRYFVDGSRFVSGPRKWHTRRIG